MANVDRPNGLTPVRYLNGGQVITTNAYTIASGYAANIFSGDPVKSTGTGKGIQAAAAGDTMRGVFAGCSYTAADGEKIWRPYWPTGTTATDIIAYIYDDPDILFSVQGNGSIAAADIGAAADLIAGTGDTSTGRSRFELDSSSIGGGGKTGVILYELVANPGNAYGTNAEVLVLLNEHELRPGTLTAV